MASDPAAKSLDFNDVTIGILTALEEEYAACKSIFDPDGRGVERSRRATSGHLMCWVCDIPSQHNGTHVVGISLLPDMGNIAAALAANILLQHCNQIKYLLMCGIAGAVPQPDKAEDHVRLGDIVVSGHHGVVHYSRGKQRDPRAVQHTVSTASSVSLAGDTLADRSSVQVELDPFAGFDFRFCPRPPSAELLAVVKGMHADERMLKPTDPRSWDSIIEAFLGKHKDLKHWKRPKKDTLIDSPDGKGKGRRHPRDGARRGKRPRVFHGIIGAADIVQSDPRRRNTLRDRFKVKAIEMESSGVAEACWIADVGYLIVRGTCDYCNTAKGENWHHYAALIAAAYTRSVVERLHPISDSDTNTLHISIPVDSSLSAPRSASLDPAPTNPSADQCLVTTSERITARSSEHRFSLPTETTLVRPPMGADSAFQETEPSNSLNELVQRVSMLITSSKWSESVPLSSRLEAQLRALPRRGQIVRQGWILLARIEDHTLRELKGAGKPLDLTRFKMLRQEAESVVD